MNTHVPTTLPRREHHLDSARGLAALTVVAGHMVCAYGLPPCLYPVIGTPLRSLWHGAAAVQFFFVLSGFVLALQFLKSAAATSGMPSISAFAVQRFFRIYPAFWVALLAGVAAKWFASPGPGETVMQRGDWWQPLWTEPAGIRQIFGESLLLWRGVGPERITPQDWTLAVEVTFSLWVPVMAFLCRRQPMGFLLVVTVAVAAMGANPILLSFAAGVLIACFRGPWCEWWSRSSLLLRLTVACLAIILYGYETILSPAQVSALITFLRDPIVAGAAGLLLVIIGSTTAQRVLQWKPLVVIGKLSYGIYLGHVIVLLTLLPWVFVFAAKCGVENPTGLWFIGLATCVVISTLLAYPLWRWVEIPGNRLGKTAAARLTKKGAPLAAGAAEVWGGRESLRVPGA